MLPSSQPQFQQNLKRSLGQLSFLCMLSVPGHGFPLAGTKECVLFLLAPWSGRPPLSMSVLPPTSSVIGNWRACLQEALPHAGSAEPVWTGTGKC
jgi:hypothetical protein